MNVKTPPFDNLNVRKALSMAIDREEVIKVLGGEKIPATSIIPEGLIGHDPNVGLKHDVSAANKFLDEAGYKDRAKFPRIKLSFNTNENHQRIAENVQAQLKKKLGIDVELGNEEWKTYIKSLDAKKLPFYRMGWVGDYPDPDTFINLFSSSSGNNHTLWKSPRYDALIKKGIEESDRDKRNAIYLEAQKLLTEEEVPIIPIYHYRSQLLVNTRIKNYPMNALHKFYANEVEIVE